MMWARHKMLVAVAAAVLLAGLVTGSFIAFRHGGQARGAAVPSPSPSPSPTGPLRSPFTGEPVPSLNRVLAVKIDNIVNARPDPVLCAKGGRRPCSSNDGVRTVVCWITTVAAESCTPRGLTAGAPSIDTSQRRFAADQVNVNEDAG